MKVKSEVKSLSRVRLFATPWTAAHQAPLSMGFSRQEYWNGVPLPSPVDRQWIANIQDGRLVGRMERADEELGDGGGDVGLPAGWLRVDCTSGWLSGSVKSVGGR